MVVRRIAVDGSELPPLGRQGEGPGEFIHPRLLAAAPGGGCVVVQDFHAPAVCLTAAGKACPPPDLGLIRTRFEVTVFMGTARLDEEGRLIAVASTTEQPYDPVSPNADRDKAISVFRFKPGDTAPTVLFSDCAALCDGSSVKFRKDVGYYSMRCWDADAAGRLIYADPNGSYRVFIGHPADGKSVVVELQEAESDDRDLERRAKAMKCPMESVPRIADVQWVGRDRFLVKPTAAASGPRMWQSGIVEVFDLAGNSYGRRVLAGDYDPEYDALFLRGRVLVIIRGGMSLLMSSLQIAPKETGTPPDMIAVEAYDLAVP